VSINLNTRYDMLFFKFHSNRKNKERRPKTRDTSQWTSVLLSEKVPMLWTTREPHDDTMGID
jgi:hypothetical protein